jgi:protein-tyrosine phosphatase
MGSSFSLFNLYGNHFHEIIPNLYIGDGKSMYQKFFLTKKKIIVINATKHIKFNKKIKSSLNYRLSINDDLTRNSNQLLYNELDNVTKLINDFLNKNYTVLVHCAAGRQRSCSIVAAYLMKYKNFSLNDAIYFIKTKRPFAFFANVNFKWALVQYEYDIKYQRF